MITPINYVEAILLHVMDSSARADVRELTYEMIVLCLTGKDAFFLPSYDNNFSCLDVRCIDLSDVSLGMGCLLMAGELLKCREVTPNQVFIYEQDKNTLFEVYYFT